MTPIERFWQRVEKAAEPGGCWNWTGAIGPTGYGFWSFRIDGKPTTRPAHRFAWIACAGSIPDGLEIDHLCRNRRCVNPLHLEPVNHATNCDRRPEPVISRPLSHPVQPVTLHPDVVPAMLNLAATSQRLRFLRKSCGLTQAEVAERVGLTQAAVSLYENGRCVPLAVTRERLATLYGVEVLHLWPADVLARRGHPVSEESAA